MTWKFKEQPHNNGTSGGLAYRSVLGLEEEDERGFDIPTLECLLSALGAQNK
jgi:hypothetical protein